MNKARRIFQNNKLINILTNLNKKKSVKHTETEDLPSVCGLETNDKAIITILGGT